MPLGEYEAIAVPSRPLVSNILKYKIIKMIRVLAALKIRAAQVNLADALRHLLTSNVTYSRSLGCAGPYSIPSFLIL